MSAPGAVSWCPMTACSPPVGAGLEAATRTPAECPLSDDRRFPGGVLTPRRQDCKGEGKSSNDRTPTTLGSPGCSDTQASVAAPHGQYPNTEQLTPVRIVA